MPKPMKLVYIEWEDSESQFDTKWRFSDEIEECHIQLCQTVGWVFDDGKKCKRIAQNKAGYMNGDERKQISNDIVIPVSAIRKIKEIKL